MIIGPNQKPPVHPFYGENYERGLDPWHEEAFPEEFKKNAITHGKRKMGWFLNDAFGNYIAFFPDGTEL